MWPRCNAPIVGTNAMLVPAFRYGSNARRSVGTVRKTFGAFAIICSLVAELSQKQNTPSKAVECDGAN
jgi:hypothetical protein